MDDITKAFINEHINDDVHQLSLHAGRYPNVNMDLAVRQITGRRKMKNKAPCFYQTDDILYPARLSLEQTSSETTAKYKAALCGGGKEFIDLTGGFGIDCYFISRKFEKAAYIERQLELCRLAEHNFKVLHADNIKVVNADAQDYLSRTTQADCIYIDPARRSSTGKKTVLLCDCEPDITAMKDIIGKKSGMIMIKLSPMLDIKSAVNDLPGITDIHILSVENDCKEVLLILKREKTEDICIHTVNFKKDGNEVFDFMLQSETRAEAGYTSALKKYLYEPNASIMKGGGFKSVSQRFNMEKLHPNTHLYTSDNFIPRFPGRTFEIISSWGNAKKDWKMKIQTEKLIRANVSVRNYPAAADDLRKKLKLFDGGDCYLFACTLADNSKTIVQSKKIKDRK